MVMASLDGAVGINVGKGRNKRRRKINAKKNRDKNKKKAPAVHHVRNRDKNRRKQNKRKNKRVSGPQIIKLAVDFSLIYQGGGLDALEKLKAFYDKGKLTSLIFIAGEIKTEKHANKLRRWLKSKNHEWAYGHVVLNDSVESPGVFNINVVLNYECNALLAKENSSIVNWLRHKMKRLRIHSFTDWPDSIEWINRLSTHYYKVEDVSEHSHEILLRTGVF